MLSYTASVALDHEEIKKKSTHNNKNLLFL